jgi:putative ABC transport system permease protein
MLELKHITKHYRAGGQIVPALNDVSLAFRNTEFVSILGPSGCGKTTMLNLIGGLDRYTSGDLLIDGKSTREFRDADWDAYRNAVIGFVFQNYNLISHLSVLDNVEMALSLSGVSAKERKERATKALTDVGLSDQLHKKPNQLSGGQMQRVAIARALVNDPDILLADEPTGALDSVTSKQIMTLMKDIARDRLVIMVTHNAKLAEQYSDRIIRLLDGRVLSDTNNVTSTNEEVHDQLRNQKTSMAYLQALKTSFKNLLTKRGRTLITAVAGSIGIIGVALVLGISTGMTNYVNDIQTDTLAGFPITINPTVQTDTFGPGGEETPFATTEDTEFPTEEVVYAYDPEQSSVLHTNVLTEEYLEYLDAMDPSWYNSISYTRSVGLQIVAEQENGTYDLVSLDTSDGFGFFAPTSVFAEIPDNPEFVQSQYDVLAGTYPDSYDELVLVIDRENKIDVSILEALGIEVDSEYAFTDLLGQEFKVIPNDVFYQNVNGQFLPRSDYEAMYLDDQSLTVTIVGILRVNEDATSDLLSPGIGYTTDLTDHVLDLSLSSDIVAAQQSSPDINVLTNQPFNAFVTYQSVMQAIGGDATPSGVQIYPATYETKDDIKTYLDAYNEDKDLDDQVIPTDLAELFSTTISSLISTITIILTAFAGISLVVSSIMIGIITYVSVIERTKEIGIMRALGARKKDISRIFNAETILIGLSSGILGVSVYYLAQGPVNQLISNFIEVSNFATLPFTYALFLVVLSSALTLLAGLIPSRIAAKKDPVIALRTE